jgi:glycosyltransferase involved in cell wall biosynthesis
MSNEEQTLIILTPGFAASKEDSTCLPMQQHFIRTLKEIYPWMKIIILSFQYPYHSNSYEWFDIKVIPFNGRNRGGLPGLLLREKIYAVLRNINRSNRVIGLLSFWYGECALVGKRFAEKNKIKHYCWILGQDARKENKHPHKIPTKAGELLALSDFLQDEFERNHNVRPFAVIPPGVDVKEVGITTRNIDVLGVGSLIPLKQYDSFIKLIAEIKREVPTLKAVLAGDGPEKNKIQNLIGRFGLQESVTLTGEIPHKEVLELMQRTKILLHPSSYEGFSGVCTEALSVGAHVISFCKPMHQDFEQWHIVRSEKEMRQKTTWILQNVNTLYNSVTVFTMEHTAKKMMELFGYK